MIVRLLGVALLLLRVDLVLEGVEGFPCFRFFLLGGDCPLLLESFFFLLGGMVYGGRE